MITVKEVLVRCNLKSWSLVLKLLGPGCEIKTHSSSPENFLWDSVLQARGELG